MATIYSVILQKHKQKHNLTLNVCSVGLRWYQIAGALQVGVRIAEPNIAITNYSTLSIVESVNAFVLNKKHILATQEVERWVEWIGCDGFFQCF